MIRSLVAFDVGVYSVVAHGAVALGALLLCSISALDADECVVAALDNIVSRVKARSVVATEVAGIEVTGPQHCSPWR